MSQKGTFWSDFKKFISRGNVVDMAVGVVIGGVFGKVVTGLVNYIINPFVGLFMDAGDLDSIKTVLKPEVLDEAGEVVTPEVALLWGTWVQTIIDFLLVALCIFVVLRILMHAKNALNEEEIAAAKQKEAEEKEKAAAKAAEEKAKAEAEQKALAEKQAQLEQAVLNQEKLLEEIRDLMKKNS